MGLKKVVLGFAFALAMPLAASATAIVTGDGVKEPFAGFDWDSAGSAWVTNVGFTLNVPGDPSQGGFTSAPLDLYYFSTATSVNREGGGSFNTPNLFKYGFVPGDTDPAKDYEFTVFSKITETATCTVLNNANQCIGSLSLTLVSGTFDIFYDTAPNANLVTGAGIVDGVKVISGSWNAGPSGVVNLADGSSDSVTFNGAVTFTDLAYINPALVGTSASTTLQFPGIAGILPGSTTAWTRPTAFPIDLLGNTQAPGADGPTNLVFQADANQFFVPEPGSLVLLASALMGMGFCSRRRNKA